MQSLLIKTNWANNLYSNIWLAALEELRVRASVERVDKLMREHIRLGYVNGKLNWSKYK